MSQMNYNSFNRQTQQNVFKKPDTSLSTTQPTIPLGIYPNNSMPLNNILNQSPKNTAPFNQLDNKSNNMNRNRFNQNYRNKSESLLPSDLKKQENEINSNQFHKQQTYNKSSNMMMNQNRQHHSQVSQMVHSSTFNGIIFTIFFLL